MKIWSALPTPLTNDLVIDEPSLERMIEASIADQVTGIFLAGTCGEGPWLPNPERTRLVKAAVKAAKGRLRIAVQVSDNSVPRILQNIAEAADAGADVAIIAPPATMMNVTPPRIVALYEGAAAKSPLPIGIYDLGSRRQFSIPIDRLESVYLLPNVELVKDSSAEPARRQVALGARRKKPGLQLFNGDEFRCIDYLEAGYDGCMFGGGVVVAPMVRRIVERFRAGDLEGAQRIDREMVAILHGVYGGPSIACWLSGLKYYMHRRKLFSTYASFLEYPLYPECRAFIDAHVEKSSA